MKKFMILALSLGLVCIIVIGAHAWLKGDFDNDGDVDGDDLAVFSENYGKSGECSNNNDCDSGEWCIKAIGDCDGEGICTPSGGHCPDYVDPVCGCDGVTYQNPDCAVMEGANVDHEGECP